MGMSWVQRQESVCSSDSFSLTQMHWRFNFQRVPKRKSQTRRKYLQDTHLINHLHPGCMKNSIRKRSTTYFFFQMGKNVSICSHQRRHVNGKEVYKKVLSIVSHQEVQEEALKRHPCSPSEWIKSKTDYTNRQWGCEETGSHTIPAGTEMVNNLKTDFLEKVYLYLQNDYHATPRYLPKRMGKQVCTGPLCTIATMWGKCALQDDSMGLELWYSGGYTVVCWFQGWLFHFWLSCLLMQLGKLQKIAQAFGFLPTILEM